ncbi:hypothetical protein [Paraliomyxa miuraensis]|uniref:hypothetical protein n=1 Tax=Paraliomyxa miuraensis TaxID=376150 RepID=UPI00224F9DC6|nr:hypothetical protein [Paraliomyxa miuraensis]MCX4247764.1 hypothetical protein [Paraliomyxa miuraensis]
MRLELLRGASGVCLGLVLLLGGCVDREPVLETDSGSSSGSTGPVLTTTSSTTTVPTTTTTTVPPDDTTTTTPVTDDGVSSSSSSTTTSSTESSSSSGSPPGCETDCPDHALDVVFVIDNSRTMGPTQLRLASAAQLLMNQLQQLEAAQGITLDLQLMVTTTDFGNPLCTPFEPPGYDPAQGSPIATACTDRLQDFTDLTGMLTFTEACTNVCPAGVAPTDPFVHVAGPMSNVPGGDVVQALQCLLPQGLNGCGYEQPLENMLQALNPSASWNQGAAPFLRDGADLALVLLTDESDCSVQDYSVMTDPAYQNINPNTGAPAASSALCWNAGISCNGPDAMGVYSNCMPVVGPLQETTRYTTYLVDELIGVQGKEIMMLALVGVPAVTAHAVTPPYEPTAGGIDDLVVREWIDGQYPVGDIVPPEFAMGVTAASKTFQLGVGPGCTGYDVVGDHWTQAQPPLRIQTVCEALDAQGSPHCCIESICDEDYTDAMACLAGMIETAL